MSILNPNSPLLQLQNTTPSEILHQICSMFEINGRDRGCPTFPSPVVSEFLPERIAAGLINPTITSYTRTTTTLQL
ncbi:hypothetical protein HanPI659440_Chr03g0118451 [Helianthus annuus]|nr:hypothetical protein HanPI659440_Chr03g0118451 [Helianthus annuus]